MAIYNPLAVSVHSKGLEEMIREEFIMSLTTEAQSPNTRNMSMPSIVEDDEVFKKSSLSNTLCSGNEIKVIGAVWDRNTDKLKFNFSTLICYELYRE